MAQNNLKRLAKRVLSKVCSPREYFRKPLPVLSEVQKTFWGVNGFLVLPGYFSDETTGNLNALIEQAWDQRKTRDGPLVVDVFIGTDDERRIKLTHAPDDARNKPYKLNDLYLEYEEVRAVVLEQRLAAILGELLGAPPLCCNTLNFEFGSQQPFHTDSLYMTPPRDLNLVATWIALEDCNPDAGPLRYFPGSHKIPPFLFSHGKMSAVSEEMPKYVTYMTEEVNKRGLKEEVFCARRGDLFIWHSQLFHGGSSIKNRALTRRSLVTHYLCAKDVPEIHGKVGEGRYYLKRSHQPVPPPKQCT